MPNAGSSCRWPGDCWKRSGSRVSIHISDRQAHQARSLFVNPMPPRTTEKCYRPRVSDRTVVATTRWAASVSTCRASHIAWTSSPLLSLLAHPLTTVLAVKGPLCRASRRALDGSGPLRSIWPIKRESRCPQTAGLPRPPVGRSHYDDSVE